MDKQTWDELTKEIQPLADELCNIAKKYDLELPGITADSDGYFTLHVKEGNFFRAEYGKEVISEWEGDNQ